MEKKVTQLLSAVEHVLERYDLTIPDENRTGEADEARLFGNAYYELETEFHAILETKKTSKEQPVYYMVNSFCYLGEVMNDGTSVEEAVTNLDGVVQTSYGVCYLPEDRIMENTSIIQWLNERCLINPNPRPIREWEES